MRAAAHVLALAPWLLVASSARGGTGRVELPSLVDGSATRLVSLRVSLSPEPAGAFRAETSVALLNATTESATVQLRVPPGEPGTAVLADRAGEPLAVAGGLASLELEPSEAVVVRVTQVVEPALRHALDRSEAGWWGATRGHLLQPVRTIEIVPPSRDAGVPVETHVEVPGRPLASALFAHPPARYAEGTLTWSGTGTQPLALAWPAIENETFVPRDREEAAAFLASWTPDRLPSSELGRVRRAVTETTAGDATHGEWMTWPATGNESRESVAALERAEPAPPPEPVAAARASAPVAVAPPERAAAVVPSPPPPERAAVAAPRPSIVERETEPSRPARAPRAETVPAPTPEVPDEDVALPEPESVSGPAIPWIRTPAQARVFLAEEKRRGPLDAPRLRAAMALVEARLGNPAPAVRARYQGEPWYAPDAEYSASRIPTGAREALTLLRTALESVD